MFGLAGRLCFSLKIKKRDTAAYSISKKCYFVLEDAGYIFASEESTETQEC